MGHTYDLHIVKVRVDIAISIGEDCYRLSGPGRRVRCRSVDITGGIAVGEMPDADSVAGYFRRIDPSAVGVETSAVGGRV